MIKGYVNKILPFSSVDGPGNRTVIFLQGCNFDCLYCHNPETINYCINCGICVYECPYDALTIVDNKVVWNEKCCKNCDLCIKVCPNLSSPKVKLMTVDEVMDFIKKVKPFISGITISGGECTLQYNFVIEIFRKTKAMGLTTFLDSNGYIPLNKLGLLVENMDMAMIDLKSFDRDEHLKLTGKDNQTVIENIKYLAEINKLYEVRTVIMPCVLDNYYNVDNISKLIASLNPNIRYKIIKYRPIGVRKGVCSFMPDDKLMKKLFNLASRNGCKNVILV
ncbi:YjjW family glycine radical enzyme activase [Caloranaerobacter azorensis]|uniref:YjjW family glycine radical enzyme activase n=1 Tax=Caloranaerobacter azorensis TaxID=116090 RepID=A0A6P1YCH3_9FIRM|nr:YjjW family glycine radical enzyme activase [Caloranaerobacter azorensis]QIB26747.1 YjjW family glycine radical enzyme activase [Caloranaerobacter azorensis]